MMPARRVVRRLVDLARRLGHERPSLALLDADVLPAIETDNDRFEGGSLFELAEALSDAPRSEPARPN